MSKFDSYYFQEKIKILNLIEKELITIWELVSIFEKQNEKQFHRFLTAQRAARNLNEAFLAFACSQGYLDSKENS